MYRKNTQQQRSFLAAGLGILGALFCTLVIYGDAEIFCITEGCNLYADFTIFGISTWWVGIIGFTLLTMVSLLKNSSLAAFIAICGLFVDALFLLLMVLTVPCVNCLIAAFFLILIYLVLVKKTAFYTTLSSKLLIIFWTVLFIINIFNALDEQFQSWFLFGNKDSKIQIYFSPSCPSCKTLFKNIDFVDENRYALLPLASNNSDILVLFEMTNTFENLPPNQALTSAMASVEAGTNVLPNMIERSWVSFKALRNQSKALKAGGHSIPFIVINGVPEGFALSEAIQTVPEGVSIDSNLNAGNSGLSFLDGTIASCTQTTENEPCED